MSLHNAAKRAIKPLFSDGSADAEYVLPVLDHIFNCAFAIILSEIKDLLTAGMTTSFVNLARNGLDSTLSSSDTPNPQGILGEVATLLNVSNLTHTTTAR